MVETESQPTREMEEKTSPEERLLRLIRGRRQVESPKRQAPAKPFVVRRRLASKWIEKYGPLKLTNQILFIFLLISLVYLGLDFIIVKPYQPRQFQLSDSMPKDIKKNKEDLTSNLKPYSYYAKEIERRQLFNSAGVIEPEGTGGIPNLEESLNNLNLIGIVYGTNPQAIIEEKKINKTHFLNKGNYIGQFKVEEILPGKVILIYNSQAYELNL